MAEICSGNRILTLSSFRTSRVTHELSFLRIQISPIPLNLTLRPLPQSLSKLLTAIINSWAVVESSAISASASSPRVDHLRTQMMSKVGTWRLGCGIVINKYKHYPCPLSLSECYNSIWVPSLVSDRILCRVDNNLFPRSERRYLIPAWVSKIIIIVFIFMKIESTLDTDKLHL